MKSDIIVIGGGASGLMAAYTAASTLNSDGVCAQVTVLEKMPRPGRKIMITGKGRCNFTNVKDWNQFSQHIRSKSNFVKSAFFNLGPQAVLEFFESYGMKTVVERGDRAFPLSYRSSDVVDTLVTACLSKGVKIITECDVRDLELNGDGFRLSLASGELWLARKVIVATGGLSYPNTGSTGDGYPFAVHTGHSIVQTFPSLTALVPRGYKNSESLSGDNPAPAPAALLSPASSAAPVPAETRPETAVYYSLPKRIARETPLSELGEKLCGIHLKNVGVQLVIEGCEAGNEFGDIDFTDGGLEGPVGFQLSRKAVKALSNGSRVSIRLDLKSGVELTELVARVKQLWSEVDKDPRSARLREKEKCRILLGKLIPWELIPAFVACNPDIMTLERRGRAASKVWVNLVSIAKALKCWEMDIVGHVGYERAVVTAGGVSTDDLIAKKMESRVCPGLFFCGEVVDIDADTGGYNLQCAFSTGALAGRSAAKSLNSDER